MGRSLTWLGFGGLVWGCFGMFLLDRGMACDPGHSPQEIEEPQYVSVQSPDIDSEFMSAIVHSFLRAVQPNDFPTDLLVGVIKDPNAFLNQDKVKEFLVYEVGFLVCVAIGILYIVLMPLIGSCFACCRCCGNCGGRMYQKQSRHVHCKRRGFYWATFLVTLIILAGNICMFFSNEATHKTVENSPEKISTTLSNLDVYLTSTEQQVHEVVNESKLTVDEVSNNLNGIGNLLGPDIQSNLRGPIFSALDSVRNTANVVNSTSVLLLRLNETLGRLQPKLDKLQTNLTDVRSRINQTLHKSSCIGCQAFVPRLNQLSVNTKLSFPGLNDLQTAVDQAEKANLNSKVKEGQDFFNNIPQMVTDRTKDIVNSAQQQLQNIKEQVTKVTDELPLDTLAEISQSLTQAQDSIKLYSPEVEWAERIRWSIGVVLCCLVLLIVVCNLFGLLLGPVGLKPKVDPKERSCTSDCGGVFLMTGVGFSFLFSWIFMLVVLILFLVGGNSYTLLCKPWQGGELYQLMDTPGLIPGFPPSVGQINVTINGIYTDCQQNKPLWSTLHLDQLVDLNDFLNVSKYTGDIEKQFENINITLPHLDLLSQSVRNELKSFSQKAANVNFSSISQQINTFYRTNLSIFADELDTLARSQPAAIKAELQGEAQDLRNIQTEIDRSIKPDLVNLNSTVNSLSLTASQMNATVESVLEKVGFAQDFLDVNTTEMVKSESRQFLDCQLGYFTRLTDWANRTITQEVGRCGPVAGALDDAETLVCSRIVESLNAFWFSLGWCILFFIPSIILSVKTAKFYRRMKYSDVYHNDFVMKSIPRPAVRPS
ncbi:prominin-2 [Chanos chanos]|uniref:Prominin-2 n=1 Tax=Chanos chanos TaxID=29144 RepID=A0A6J2VAS7_CHACN|nr:prominin-1-A-like [Chanos chanos]